MRTQKDATNAVLEALALRASLSIIRPIAIAREGASWLFEFCLHHYPARELERRQRPCHVFVHQQLAKSLLVSGLDVKYSISYTRLCVRTNPVNASVQTANIIAQ